MDSQVQLISAIRANYTRAQMVDMVMDAKTNLRKACQHLETIEDEATRLAQRDEIAKMQFVVTNLELALGGHVEVQTVTFKSPGFEALKAEQNRRFEERRNA
tara:strand:- start:806 stop:1111 length:306 start_codon:yes stop_codon:yes gene_type:complete